MAHTVTITKLNDGPKYAIFHVFLKCDGQSGDLVDQIILDPSTLVPPKKTRERVHLQELWWDCAGFVVRFEFNSIPDTPVWVISQYNNHVCFEEIGGLADRSGLDGAGALQISTVGFDSDSKQGTIIVKVKK